MHSPLSLPKVTDLNPVHAFDLHVHSTNSDGRMTPDEVIACAAGRGVRVFTFTDHSGATYSPELVSKAKLVDVEIPFPAAEVSTIHRGRKHHILCFGFAVLEPEFAHWIRFPTDVKNEVYFAIVHGLRAKGIAIPPPADIMRGIQGNTCRYPEKWLLSRTLIASYVAHACNISIDEAKAMFMSGYEQHGARIVFVDDERPREQRYLPSLDVVRRARDLGAVPVLAHPFWWSRNDVSMTSELMTHIEELVACGLMGVETRTPHHDTITFPNIREFEEWVEQRGLLISGGSDFHANGKTELGQQGISLTQFSRLAERAVR